jgi:phosphoglycolate phosphatase-like HAD superfamily hydrolase
MHTILFDIDGTLLSSGGAGKAAMETALCQAFGVAEIRGRIPFSGRTDRAIGRDLLEVHGVEASEPNLQRLASTYLSLLPRCLATHPGQVLPGIAALLDRLQQPERIVIGLLTGNLRHGARLKLGHYGIYDYFAFGGFGDEHFDRNDVARDALAAAKEHVNGDFRSDRVWVIGDTPLDVSCARHIGAKAVAVATGWTSREELRASKPDLFFDDLSDPLPFLDQILAGA